MSAVYRLGWLLFRGLFGIYFRWRVHGARQVPKQGAAILAGNHASFLDPPLIGAATSREVHYLARKTLFRNRVFGALLRSVNSVPVDRDGGGGAGMKAVMDRLGKGGAVVLFPEGTRSRDGRLQQARSGIGLIVIKSGAPVVPVRVFGTFEAYGRHARFPRPSRVSVTFGSPLGFDRLREEARTCSKERLKEIYQEVADKIMEAIAALESGRD